MKSAPIQTKDQSAVTGFHFNTRGNPRSIDWEAYAIGEYRIECPSCGRGGRDKNVGLKIEHDGGVMHCFRCSFVESFKPERGAVVRAPTIKPQRPPTQVKHEVLSQWGRDLWAACHGIDGVALQYLNYRRCVVPPKDSHLRWHPSIKHPSGYVGAALVALVTDAQTREPLSLHRTWVTPTGKANVSPPRMPLANHSLKNGVIRLWSDDYVTCGLGIAEGIETALSLAHAFTPVWSVIDAGHMAKFAVIPSVEILTIAADNDQAGRNAARECASRWLSANRKVRITRQRSNDLNDILMEAAA
jgi:putative DNA primase/helicase